MSTKERRISIGLQRSGRLHVDSLKLLTECGLKFDGGLATSRLRACSANFPLDILFLRDDDIPGYVADGVVDIGIVGENILAERNGDSEQSIKVVERLGFSRCRLAVAVPKEFSYEGTQSLEGKRIATCHPTALSRYLSGKGIKASIHEISGSVEIAPSLGLAEAICDLVSSGNTLISNGLKEVEVILHSQAVLISHTALQSEKERMLEKLLFRVRSVQRAKNSKYVLLNAPNTALDRISEILPGMKSPTIMPLAEKGWSSVHSVMNEDEFWEKIELLRDAGAQGILIIPIEKMVL